MLEISKQINNTDGDTDALGAIADIYTEMGDLESAGEDDKKDLWPVLRSSGPFGGSTHFGSDGPFTHPDDEDATPFTPQRALTYAFTRASCLSVDP